MSKNVCNQVRNVPTAPLLPQSHQLVLLHRLPGPGNLLFNICHSALLLGHSSSAFMDVLLHSLVLLLDVGCLLDQLLNGHCDGIHSLVYLRSLLFLQLSIFQLGLQVVDLVVVGPLQLLDDADEYLVAFQAPVALLLDPDSVEVVQVLQSLP